MVEQVGIIGESPGIEVEALYTTTPTPCLYAGRYCSRASINSSNEAAASPPAKSDKY